MMYLNVTAGARLRASSGSFARLFAVTYAPRIFVSLTKPQRLGGRLLLALGNPLSFETTPLGSKELVMAFDVPVDWASEHKDDFLRRLVQALPGPRKLWKDSGAIVGLCCKKPRGTSEEFAGAMQACTASGKLQYLCTVGMFELMASSSKY